MEDINKKHAYAVDLKIYEPANIYEVPFAFPENMSNADSLLKLGYHTVVAHCTEAYLEEFEEWVGKHQSILKIIGVTKMG